MSDVIIIGGGFAGLSAAVALADRGLKVSLFERRPLLGGRAYSVKDQTTGDIIDNGQHILMGCYHHTRRFLEKIGTLPLLQFQNRMRVDFADANGNPYRLECPDLPAPLHLLVGLIRLKSLSLKEKISLIRMMGKVKRMGEDELNRLDHLSALQWLTLLGQTRESIQNFWEPLIVGTINERPDLSSAKLLAVVLREALLKTKEEARMALSTVGLSELYTEAARRFVEERGGSVHLRKGLSKIESDRERVTRVFLEDGSERSSRFYLSSIPPDALAPLLNGNSASVFSNLDAFQFSPILSINLWFDRPILDERFVGLLNSPIHWVFNKGAILSGSKNYVSLVVSAAYDLKDKTQDELTDLSLKALHEAIPASRTAALRHCRILKELKATPSLGPGSDALRPPAKTGLENFFLAGDWTATGLPATIEGAVKSGHAAAELILEKCK